MARDNRFCPGSILFHDTCTQNCETDDANPDLHFHYSNDGSIEEPGTASLPHQCDRWVIGGPDEIRAMIAELQALLMRAQTAGAPDKDNREG